VLGFENISNDWKEALKEECSKPYFTELLETAESLYEREKVAPKKEQVFRAFCETPYQDVKVVILGQDPYHGPGQAEGLAFSVPEGISVPPSLRNIYQEIASEYNLSEWYDKNKSGLCGSLVSWAKQGVFLLNTILTVREGEAFSHKYLGWDKFTDGVICALDKKQEPVCFLLWGAPAQKKEKLIHNPRHMILKAPHPSPLSAYRGFLGCGHFKEINEFLQENSLQPIDWTGDWVL